MYNWFVPRHASLALRSLLRARAFSAAVIASLAVSMGAVVAVFAIADAVLFRALPYRQPDRLAFIGSVRPQRTNTPFSLPELMEYTARTRTVDVAAYATWNAAMATTSVAQRLQGLRMTANAFDVLGVSPSAGRLLRPSDDRPDAPHVVVLSDAFWRQQFAGRQDVIGQTLRLNEQVYEVVGVLPAHLPLTVRGVDVVVPLQPDLDPRRTVRTSTNFLVLFGRLRSDATLASARHDLDDIAAALRGEYPEAYASKIGVAVTPLQEYLVGPTRQTLAVMLGAAGLLLAIALANVLNLFVVRGISKQGETSLRRALGASAWDLALGVSTEAWLLAVVGAIAGAVVARSVVGAVVTSGISVPRLDEVTISSRSFLLAALLMAVATVLFALVQLAWALRANPRQALAALGRGLHGSRGQARLRSAFLVAQVALAVLLTIVTGTMARSFARLQSVDLGFHPDSVFVARLSFPSQQYRTVADLNRFAVGFERALRALPGTGAVGAISIAPLSGNLATINFSVVGRAPAHVGEQLSANLRWVTPGYFGAVRAAVVRGRGFSEADDDRGAKVAIISNALAKTYFGSVDPIGRVLMADDNNTGPRPVIIVGVVGDMRHVSVDGPPAFDIYLPVAQIHPDGLTFAIGSQFWAIRTSDGAGLPRSFSRVLEQTDRNVAMAAVQPLRSLIDASLAPRRLSVLALIGFACVALVLATIGAYGVVAYSAAQRTREIGLRLALGANGGDVARALVVPMLRLTALGVTIGVVAAIVSAKAVAGLLFGVSATDPTTLVLVSAALMLTTLIAAVIPAARAARIDPSVALLSD